MRQKHRASKEKVVRPKILKLSQKEVDLMMEEMPRRYSLLKYQTWRNLELEHRDRSVHSFVYPGSLSIHQSSIVSCMKQISKHQRQTSKAPHKLERLPLLDDTFQSKIISKKQLNVLIERIKKDKAVASIKSKQLKQIFTKEVDNLLTLSYRIRNTFDLKCYLTFGFDTFFYHSDEADAVNNKMKDFHLEIMEQLFNFKEQTEVKPVNVIEIPSKPSISISNKSQSFSNEKAIIDFANAKFQPNEVTLARKMNLGYNFQRLRSEQLSKICPKYFYLKQQTLDSHESQYQISFEGLTFRQFIQIEKEVKHYLKLRNQQFLIIQVGTTPKFMIQDDN